MSQALITVMTNEDLLKHFNVINIKQISNPPVKSHEVPALLLASNKRILIKHEAFQWLQRVKEFKMNMIIKNMGNFTQQQYGSMMNNIQNHREQLSYDKLEMSGMDDIFVFLNDNEMIPHNYVSPTANLEVIITPDKDKKLNEKDHKKAHHQLLKDRDKQSNEIKKINDDIRSTFNKR
jgi:hypothetical protein